MTVVRLTLRNSRGELAHWSSLLGLSLALHLAALFALIVLPRAFRPKLKFPEVYTVNLMSLPAGAPGPPAASQAPAAAAKPAAAPPAKTAPPAKPKPAIKIPDKPTTKVVKPKTAQKPKAASKAPVAEPKNAPVEDAARESGDEASQKSAGDSAAAAPSPAGGVSAGGTAAGGVAGGQGGAGGLVDDPTFQYGWYIANIQGIVSRNWSRPIKPGISNALVAVVRFRIQKDGRLTEIQLDQSSGDAALDRSALRAIEDSNPLPPLPYQFGKDSVGLRLEFELNP